MSNSVYSDLYVENEYSYEPIYSSDNFYPFAILVYDDVHVLRNGKKIVFYDNLNNDYVVFKDNSLLRNIWGIDGNNRMILESSFDENIKYYYFRDMGTEEFLKKVFQIANVQSTIASPILHTCFTCKSGVNLLERTTPNTLVNAISLMAEPRMMGIFVVRRLDLARYPVQIIEDIFEKASYMNLNFYVDIGLGFTQYYSQLQIDTVYAQLSQQNFMFGVVNAPFMTKVGTAPVIVPDTFNVFVTAGYIVKTSKIAVNEIQEKTTVSQESSEPIKLGREIMSAVPASFLYFNYVYYNVLNRKNYNNIINRNIGALDGGIDIVYKPDQITEDWTKATRINPLIYSVYNNRLYLYNNLNGYRQNNPLEEEHWGRLAIDIANVTKKVLKSIIGISSKSESKEIDKAIDYLKKTLDEEIFDKTNMNSRDLEIQYKTVNENQIVFDMFIYLPKSIKKIYLTTVVV